MFSKLPLLLGIICLLGCSTNLDEQQSNGVPKPLRQPPPPMVLVRQELPTTSAAHTGNPTGATDVATTAALAQKPAVQPEHLAPSEQANQPAAQAVPVAPQSGQMSETGDHASELAAHAADHNTQLGLGELNREQDPSLHAEDELAEDIADNEEANGDADGDATTTVVTVVNQDAVEQSEAAVDGTGGEDEPAAPKPAQEAIPSPYTVSLRQSEVDTVLAVRPHEGELPSLEYRPDSRALDIQLHAAKSTSEQIPELIGMLDQLGQELQAAILPNRLVMQITPQNYPEYAVRLAKHASTDPNWRALRRQVARRGEARQAAVASYFSHLTPQVPLHPELDEIFASLGLTVRVAEVTDCELLSPGSRWLRRNRIRASSPVPVGCITRFEFGQAKATEPAPESEETAEVEAPEEPAPEPPAM